MSEGGGRRRGAHRAGGPSAGAGGAGWRTDRLRGAVTAGRDRVGPVLDRPVAGQLLRSAVAVLAVAALIGVLLLFRSPGHDGSAPVVAGPPPGRFTASTPSQQPTATHRPATRPTVAAARTAHPVAPRPALTVLNDSRITGLAHLAAAELARGGWPIAMIGNLPGRTIATTVYYPTGELAAARRLAAAFPQITRVLPRYPGLPGTGLVVVVTRYWL